MSLHSGSPLERGTVRGVFAGPIRALRSAREPGGVPTAWRSAILKAPLSDPVHVGALGLIGDAQKERKHHGGPFKAVLVYGASHYAARWDVPLGTHADRHADALRAMSTAIDASRWGFGAFGENITLDGPTEQLVCLGDEWRIGECVLRVTEPRGPCATLTRRWMRPQLLDDVKATAAAGWYNAVVREGTVRLGDVATLESRTAAEWTVARVFDLLEQRRVSRADLEALSDHACAHEALRARLRRRLATSGRTED